MLVKQRSEYDCALAVLSMVSGREYDDIFDADFCKRIEDATTCTGNDLIEACSRAGFEKDKNMRTIYVGHNVNPVVLRQLIWGRPAMIQVPSLNHEGSEHFVYWDGHGIYDPSNKQVYKYLQHLYPTYITFFDHTDDIKRYQWIRNKSKDHVAHAPSATLLPGAGLKVVYQHYGMAHNKPSLYVHGQMLDDYVDAIIKKDEECILQYKAGYQHDKLSTTTLE